MITTPVYTTDQIRKIERNAFSSVPSYVLMERAGRTISDLTISEIPQGKNRVLILAGPGNNGGDAYIAASNLQSTGFEVTVVSVGESQKKDQMPKKPVRPGLKAAAQYPIPISILMLMTSS
jgi:NAD(P)H-hydrate repair Nnr-like enzyme with NAD(P)H-hydrate epimerase domain